MRNAERKSGGQRERTKCMAQRAKGIEQGAGDGSRKAEGGKKKQRAERIVHRVKD